MKTATWFVFLSGSFLLLTGTPAPAQTGQPAATPKASPGGAAARPNIVLFLSDDHGVDYVGCYGNQVVRTPNIDSLARGGMIFNRVFAASPTCSPSRAAAFTGLWPQRNGTMGNHTDCRPGIKSLPDYLRPLGYRVVAVNKTDVRPESVFDWEYLPATLPTDPKFRRYRNEGLDTRKVDAFLAEHAREHSGQPLCLLLGDSGPHVVWETNRIYDPAALPMNPLLVDTPKTRLALANYYQDITTTDTRLGEVLASLQRCGLATNTLFIYTTDQGAEWPRCKWTLYDSGLRVPFIVRWPGVVKPGTRCDALLSLIDLTPTFATIAGGEAPKGIDGVSFEDLLLGRATACRHELFAAHTGDGTMNLFPQRAVRDERYKYILNLHLERDWTTHFTKVAGIPNSHAEVWDTWVAKAKTDPAAARLVDLIVHHPAEELYDTQADPYELTNLVSRPEMKPVLARLRDRLAQWRRQVGEATGSTLPADVPINQEAGRGGYLVVTARLESGEELPMMVDTGTACSFLDKSLEPKLGKPLDTRAMQSWGVPKTYNVYAAPKLYLGGAPLMMPSTGVLTDDCTKWGSVAGRPIMGMLSYDCLRQYCIQLDFAAGKMRFLDSEQADKQKWGKAFPIVPLNSHDARPAVSLNLFGAQGPHSLIDSGFTTDGWLMPQFYQQWTNQAVPPARGEARWPNGMFGGEKYPFVFLPRIDVESDGIGLCFLARHLVTLDFPKETLYLQRQSIGPLPDPALKTTRMAALEPLIFEVLREELDGARNGLAKIEQSGATALEKAVARSLVAALENGPKPTPADAPPAATQLSLGNAQPELAEVGWLKPAANRIPFNERIASPLLDSGKIFATGLYAHSPSRYVFNLGGKWKRLRGEAGLHTAFQPPALGVVYIIKADGKELFRSAVIRGAAQAHYDVEVAGVKTVELLVENALDHNWANWSLWLDPTLLRE